MIFTVPNVISIVRLLLVPLFLWLLLGSPDKKTNNPSAAATKAIPPP